MEDAEQHQQRGFAQVGEASLDRARPDFDVLLVERFGLRWGEGCHDDSLQRGGAGFCYELWIAGRPGARNYNDRHER